MNHRTLRKQQIPKMQEMVVGLTLVLNAYAIIKWKDIVALTLVKFMSVDLIGRKFTMSIAVNIPIAKRILTYAVS